MTSPRRFRLAMALGVALAGGCGDDAATTPDGGPGDGSVSDAAIGDGPVGDVAIGGGETGGSVEAGGGGDAGTVTQAFVLLHTNDLHSHLMGWSPEADYTPATPGDDATVGGLARLAAHIGAARAAAGTTPVLLLDSGDFMMGTGFQVLGLSNAVELVEMGKLKYDAITLGNHELDWGPLALAGILGAAVKNGFTVPIVSTNLTFSATEPGDDQLAMLQTAGLLRRKLVKDVGGIKVGIFGLLGKDAADVSPLKKPLTFADITATARAAVTELRQMDKVDVVIALSHSGIDEMGNGEDRRMADDAMVKAAGGIDVIVSGHTHDKLSQPFKTGNTLIVQAGAYGRYLGNLQLTATKSGGTTSVTMTKYDLESIDDTVAGDPATQASVETYITAIDTLLNMSGLSYKKVIGETSTDITAAPYAENGLGDLVTDAYLTVTRALQPAKPPVIAFDASGDIRDEIKKGKTGRVWFADLFRVQPLGISPDMQPGYPLVTFYINGTDIKSGLELSAAAKTLQKPDYFLQVSGLNVEVQASAPLFMRVKSVTIGGTPVNLADKTTCYKLVTNLYVASLLNLVEGATGGLLSVKPKQEDCTTLITDLTTQIVDANPMTPAVEQLKEWQALVGYVGKLPDTDANMIPNIPAAYGAPATPPRVLITP
jgi:5'-nucleotidase/UDP-sugar diphosphatase